MSQFKIEEVEAALIALLRQKLENVRVAGISGKDLDKEGNLVAPPPAALVLFDTETQDPQRDNQRRTYQTTQVYRILIGTKDMSSVASQRSRAFTIISQVKDVLAGARLALADGSKSMPMTISTVQLEQIRPEGVWYSLEVSVEAVAQFSGANA